MPRLSIPGLILAILLLIPLSPQANPKYQQYTSSTLEKLLLLCVEGDDSGCYFYGGRQAKAGKLKEAHDAFLIGAQNAKTRSGYVCMFQLARLLEAGQGVDEDLVQAYRWLTVLTRVNSQQDLRNAAAALRAKLATRLPPDRIAVAEAMARRIKVN